ncbi:MAG: ImmA/IrrE family metallo-endopeptidase [Lachnospiraceae bacterium]|jgi:hypothetical protein|nr:ImmA/IrrE family metallo-endopeptidase [Lachnospiraceae bacterium]
MYCRNEFVNDSIINQCNMLNASITLSSKLNICAALTYCYNGKNYIIVNDKLSEQKRVFSILHELSHIDLGYIGEKYEKKVDSSIYEKIVNLNLVYKNRRIINNKVYILLYLYAIISEPILTKKIVFGGKNV